MSDGFHFRPAVDRDSGDSSTLQRLANRDTFEECYTVCDVLTDENLAHYDHLLKFLDTPFRGCPRRLLQGVHSQFNDRHGENSLGERDPKPVRETLSERGGRRLFLLPPARNEPRGGRLPRLPRLRDLRSRSERRGEGVSRALRGSKEISRLPSGGRRPHSVLAHALLLRGRGEGLPFGTAVRKIKMLAAIWH